MSDVQKRPEMDEQQNPQHSPVEHEFSEDQPDEVDDRAWYNRIGTGIGVLLAIAFVAFAVTVVVFVLIDAI